MILSWLLQPAVGYAVAAILGAVVQAWTAPRLKAMKARRKCSDRVLKILVLCSNLEGVSVERPSLQGERERWISQLDEATRWLADNWQSYALTYAQILDLSGMMAGYAGAVRAEWLSDRPLEQRVHRIQELTARIQTIYFVRRLRSAGDRPAAIRELREMISGPTSPHTS